MAFAITPITYVAPSINPIKLAVTVDQIMAPVPSILIAIGEFLRPRPVLHPLFELSGVHRPVVVNIYTMPAWLVFIKVSFVGVFVSFN